MEDLSFDDIITSPDPYLSPWRRLHAAKSTWSCAMNSLSCDNIYSRRIFQHQYDRFNNFGGKKTNITNFNHKMFEYNRKQTTNCFQLCRATQSLHTIHSCWLRFSQIKMWMQETRVKHKTMQLVFIYSNWRPAARPCQKSNSLKLH